MWGIIPFGQGLTLFDFQLGILYTLALSSLGVTRGLIEDRAAKLKLAFALTLVPGWGQGQKINLAVKQNKSSTNYKLTALACALKFLIHKILWQGSTHMFLSLPPVKGRLRLTKSIDLKRNYSTNSTFYSSLIHFSFEEFAHWFSGFCDAESFFFISDSGNNFSFYFGINLHIDDIKVLQYISHRLGVGKISTNKQVATLKSPSGESMKNYKNY